MTLHTIQLTNDELDTLARASGICKMVHDRAFAEYATIEGDALELALLLRAVQLTTAASDYLDELLFTFDYTTTTTTTTEGGDG